MSWRVQSNMEGPLLLNDIGLTFTRGQIRDLDLLGRENAERSNDIKIALAKGWIRELEKGSAPVSGSATRLPDNLQQTIERAGEVATAQSEIIAKQAQMIEQLEERGRCLEERLAKYQEDADRKEVQHSEFLSRADKVLEEIRSFAERDPLRLKEIKDALVNIQAERGYIRQQKQELESSGTSETEIEAQQRILDLKDQKLEKNSDELGKTISKEADSVKDALEALDALGI